MKKTILERVLNRFGFERTQKRDQDSGGGSYQGGSISRLNSDWIPTLQTGDAAIRNDLRLMRTRCRELERDDDYVRKFLTVLENNVLGHQGITLEMDIQDDNGTK